MTDSTPTTAIAATASTTRPAPIPLWRRHPVFAAAIVASLFAAFYWFMVASDRYVSEARVIVQRADLSGGQSMDFSSLIAGTGGTNRNDQLLMRDHLLSMDMLRKLETQLKLRQHYGTQGDWLSRLWSPEAPMEVFMAYFRSRVSVELDEYAGVLSVRVQAYTPEMARDIAQAMVTEGEATMNATAHALAREQVEFLTREVNTQGERAKRARTALLDYQNRKGMVSPQAAAETVAAIISRLESQLTDLQTRRTSQLGYLQPDSATIVELNLQIDAVQRQLTTEKSRLTAPGGKTLNATVEEFQRLQMEAEFAQEIYKTSLVALERGRVEATRTLKKVSVLQSAGLPEKPQQPLRLYNTIVFIITALLIAGVLQLLGAIVRDHTD
jgi:capsular polysaccharide transport system permease protein